MWLSLQTYSKFTSYAVLCTEPVILIQLITGHGVSGPCLHVTKYYTAALVMLFTKDTVWVCCLSHVQSHFVILLSLDLSLLFGKSAEQMNWNLHGKACTYTAGLFLKIILLWSRCWKQCKTADMHRQMHKNVCVVNSEWHLDDCFSSYISFF